MFQLDSRFGRLGGGQGRQQGPYARANVPPPRDRPDRRPSTSRRIGVAMVLISVPVSVAGRIGLADNRLPPEGVVYYSTAAPPGDFPGPAPSLLLAMADPAPAPGRAGAAASEDRAPMASVPEPGTPAPAPSTAPPASAAAADHPSPPEWEPQPADDPAPPRVAKASTATPTPRARPATARPSPAPSVADAAEHPAARPEADPIAFAKRSIAECRQRYQQVRDYTCKFIKRERLPNGRLTPYHTLVMKARTRPQSVYFRFLKPTPGREAIYVAGRNGGRVLAHDVGIGKVLAGTLALEPRGARAMEDCRHPITEAGLGHLIETVAQRWDAEMHPGETQVVVHANARVGDRPCTLIESTHPRRQGTFLFHKVKLFIDHELGLPVRFEAYDWPRRPGQAPELVEEYTYLDLRLNPGLTDHDFDTANRSYSFGRF